MTDEPKKEDVEVVGRSQASFGDDALCETCQLWFRRNELEMIPIEERVKLMNEGKVTASPIWGKCPKCHNYVFPSPTLK